MKKHYVEIVEGVVRKPREDYQPVMSSFREATDDEVKSAQASFDAGECDHTLFRDEAGWMYDERICDLCGAFIALI